MLSFFVLVPGTSGQGVRVQGGESFGSYRVVPGGSWVLFNPITGTLLKII